MEEENKIILFFFIIKGVKIILGESMKKLTYVLLLIVLAIPFLAKAENNNPTIRPFEAIVVNEDGITFYNKDLGTNITYRKGEMITVYGNINGGLFLEGLDVSISFSDIKLYKD